MNTGEIINYLKSNHKHFNEIRKFSNKPGIYSIFFSGQEFPIKSYLPQPDEIIYLGKTESSQISRVLKTHFKTGKTGSSTLRRTIGSILRESHGFIPVPRNDSDYIKKKKQPF